MSEALTEHRSLERKLVHIRWINAGCESAEEDALLEQMDEVWWDLTDEERAAINKEPPKSLIRTWPDAGANGWDDVDVFSAPGNPPRVGEVA